MIGWRASREAATRRNKADVAVPPGLYQSAIITAWRNHTFSVFEVVRGATQLSTDEFLSIMSNRSFEERNTSNTYSIERRSVVR